MKDIKKNKVKMIGELQDLRRPRPVNLNPSKTSAMGIKIPLRFSPSLIFGLLIFFVTINQFLWFNTASAESQTESRISKSQAPKSILILYSAGLHLPAYRKNLVAFYSGLERAGFPAKNVYFEQLDLIQINSQAYRRNLLELLRIKYAGKNIDLIVTLEGLARDYILKEGRDFFPQAPLLAVLSADTLLKNDSSRRLVQIPSILGFAETLEGAMTLFPQTKQLFVVVGSGEDEQRWEQDARSRFAPWTGKLKFEFSSGLTYEEMLQRISSLPADAIVLYVAFFKDKTGRAFIPRDVAINLTKKSNAPVFGLYDEILPLVVGGFMISYGNEGDRAAKLALDILNGHFPLNQPLTTLPILITPQFNWIQLDRWGVSTNQLPKGSLVINQPASIWKDYKRYVLVFLVLLFLQSGMIIALLELHRRRKRAELNRKIAEAALSESEERYRTAIEQANDGVVLVKGDRHLFVNHKMVEIFGYDRPDEIIGQPINKIVHPDDQARVKDISLRRQNGEEVPPRHEFKGQRKNGELLHIEVSATKTTYRGEGVALAYLRDITERKKMEEELRHSHDELEKRVQDRTAQLEAVNKELEGFSYSISHDLKAPLRHIIGFIALLNKQLSEGLDVKSRHYLQVISDSAVKMRQLIEDILSFSRMGRVEMKRSPLNLNDMVQELIRMTQTEVKEREIIWSLASLPEVYGDPTMIKMVLENLIANAVKYTRGRGRAEIGIGCLAGQAGVEVFYVKDNGVGFDMAYKDKLFGLFQRLHHEKDFEGTGLGLANIRRIIDRHGGRTWAEGVAGEGATFYFSLPKKGR